MSQSLVTIRLHVIFSTKDRKPLISGDVEPPLYSYFGRVAQSCDSHIVCMGGTENHVHLFLSLSKNYSLADVVESLKTGTSKWLKTQGPRFSAFYWQRGYAAFSVGKSGHAALIKYINNQKTHHGKIEFKEELLEFLKKYEVPYKEQYLWD